jgi:hypothetical protein
MPFGRPTISYQKLKNFAALASEEYQDLRNIYFRKDPDLDSKDANYPIKTLGFTQSGTNTAAPAAKRGLAIGAFTPSTGTKGGVYAVWDKNATESDIYLLGAGDPTAQGVSAYVLAENTDGEFEQAFNKLYYTNGIDPTAVMTSAGTWSQAAAATEPYGAAGTVAKYLAWHNFMMFAARTVNAPNKLNVSNAGDDTTYAGNTKSFRHEILGMKSLGEYLMVYTKKEVHAVTGSVPSALSFRQLPQAHPCVSHRSIRTVVGDNGALEHWYLGADYVWATNGSTFRRLGADSWENYRSSLSSAQLAIAAATYDTITGQYWLSVPLGAGTSNSVTWAYDPLADLWIEKPYFSASCWTSHGSPTPTTYFLDANATGKAYTISGNGIASPKTTLAKAITTSTTQLSATNTGFPSSGVLSIGNESIFYNGTSVSSYFDNCIRGYAGTTAAVQASATAVYLAHQFRYRTKHLDFGAPNLIKKFQVIWVRPKVATIDHSLSVDVNIDQYGFSRAKDIPLKTTGTTWGAFNWGEANWGAPSTLITPTNRAALTGRGKTIKFSFEDNASIQATEVYEAELRLRPLKVK